jgi:hypothetical protein
MKKVLLFLAIVALYGCGERPGPPKPAAKAPEDPRLTAIKEAIAKTSPEGKAIIEKVKGLKPEVNDVPASKSLNEIIEEFSKEKGHFNLIPIGWEASQKKNGRWKILFHYQDYQKQFRYAEWEYNPENNKLYPFELNNAPQFWTGLGSTDKGKKK